MTTGRQKSILFPLKKTVFEVAQHMHLAVNHSRRLGMAMVVTELCVGCRYTDCVVVCPCECFYGDERQLYIDPNECIDCEACIPECPAEAIFSESNIPAAYRSAIELNALRTTELKVLGKRITEKQERT